MVKEMQEELKQVKGSVAEVRQLTNETAAAASSADAKLGEVASCLSNALTWDPEAEACGGELATGDPGPCTYTSCR